MNYKLAIVAMIACGQVFGDEGPKINKGSVEASAKPPYVHTVVFYMKKDAPKDEVENLIADAHRLLAKVPSVREFRIGRPAEKGTPNLAVTDFNVSFMMLFDDYAGLQEYLEHKLHVEFREKHAKHAERILVYDFVNQMK